MRLKLQGAWLQACCLDVAVLKPGNVSLGRPGHRMAARDFLVSARAAEVAMTAPGRRVGTRIEDAVLATWEAVGCNTNLGIVLLLAPLLVASESLAEEPGPQGRLDAQALRAALARTLHGLDRSDARSAFRAIARAQPAGLGEAPQADVRRPAQTDLRTAMGLAAGRDRIARQYVDDYAEVFDVFESAWRPALALAGPQGLWPGGPAEPAGAEPLLRPDLDGFASEPPAATVLAMQSAYLQLLASAPDTHIVRKHGEAAAHEVQQRAQEWVRAGGPPTDAHSLQAWQAWDEELKERGLNPGTCADLAVATACVATLLS